MISKQPDDWSLRQWPFSSCLTAADFWFFSEAYMVPLLYSCRFIEMQDGLPGVVLNQVQMKWAAPHCNKKNGICFLYLKISSNLSETFVTNAHAWQMALKHHHYPRNHITSVHPDIHVPSLLMYKALTVANAFRTPPARKKMNPELCVQYLKSISTIPESQAHVKQTDRRDRASALSFSGNSPLVPRLLLHPG